MDIGSLLKFLHVASVIAWVGGGLTMVLLGAAARRAADRDSYMRVIQQVIFLAPRLFVPSSVAAFLFGLLTAFFVGWDFMSPSSLWLWLGLAGFIATFTTGNFLIKPRADAIVRLTAREGNSEHANALAEEVLSIAEFDYLMLFVVVADMVMKPAVTNWPLILAFVSVLVAGALYFLAPVVRKPVPTKAGAI